MNKTKKQEIKLLKAPDYSRYFFVERNQSNEFIELSAKNYEEVIRKMRAILGEIANNPDIFKGSRWLIL